MEYTPPTYTWWYVIGASMLLLAFLWFGRRGGWPVLMLAFVLQTPTNLTAQWDSPISATVTWTAITRSCLSVQHRTGERAFIGCWEKPGYHEESYGAVGPLDAAYHPQSGDIYALWTPDGTTYAPLVARPVYFPLCLF